jgi:hypothetical protein
MGMLSIMFRSTGKDDELEIYIDQDETDQLVLSMSNSTIGKRTDAKLKLLDINEPSNDLDSIVPDVKITMDADEFHKVCKNMASIGPDLDIKCTNTTLILTCKGKNASYEVVYTVGATGSGGVKIRSVSQSQTSQFLIQGIYDLKHLNLFAKYASLSSCIELNMKKERFPLCIVYQVATLGEFMACISPTDPDHQDTYASHKSLYPSDDDDA